MSFDEDLYATTKQDQGSGRHAFVLCSIALLVSLAGDSSSTICRRSLYQGFGSQRTTAGKGLWHFCVVKDFI